MQERQSVSILTTFLANERNWVIDGELPIQSEADQQVLAKAEMYDLTRWSWPGMYAHLANDGKHGQPQSRCNTKVQAWGHIQAIKAIPPLDITKPDWAASEILWSYGPSYWRRNRKQS